VQTGPEKNPRGAPLDRRGSPWTLICTTNHPRSPSLRPFRFDRISMKKKLPFFCLEAIKLKTWLCVLRLVLLGWVGLADGGRDGDEYPGDRG